MMKTQWIVSAVLATLMVLGTVFSGMAEAQSYQGNAHYYHHRTYFQRHPYQKKAAIGAGIGAGTGLLLGGRGGLVKGAVIGGAAGTGYEYLKKHY